MTESVRATINGKPYAGEVPAEELLLDFLRDRLGLTGTKQSCEVQV
jgi:aerobic carbon-monoxide dehydrogenase small subunit